MMKRKYFIIDEKAKKKGDRTSDGRTLVSSSSYLERKELTYLEAQDLGAVTEDVFSLIEPVSCSEYDENIEKSIPWGIKQIGAIEKPELPNVKVAVIDTGIDTNHPAFEDIEFNNKNLMDFTTDENGVAGEAKDNHGHGTHVAGTIFGKDVRGQRIGVAPGIQDVLIAKVCDKDKPASAFKIINAIQWALRENADIISLSLGINFPSIVNYHIKEGGVPEDIAACRAIKDYRVNFELFDAEAQSVWKRAKTVGKGAILVAASGNESRRIENPNHTVEATIPGAANHVISVGAVDQELNVTSFSNTGCVLSAPGVSVLSSVPGGKLGFKEGTSMAVPHVVGVCALWTQKIFKDKRRPPSWTIDIESYIRTNAIKLNGSTLDCGVGLVNAPEDLH